MSVQAHNLVPVPIHDFIAGASAPVDLYLRLSETKFIQLVKAGQKIDINQLKTYEDKTVDYLWVVKEEYSKLINNNIAIAGLLIAHDKVDFKQKNTVLSQTAASVFLELNHIGLTFESYAHSKQVVDATIAVAEAHKDINALITSLNECSTQVVRHALAVSYISVLVAHALKWENKHTIEKLALGALLIDIGLKTLPSELITKPKIQMSHEELQLYEEHPFKGMQLLMGLGIVPDDVIAIVYEHHENSIGQGYPRKLRGLKMHPLSRVVSLVNQFVSMIFVNPDCSKPKSPRDAVMAIEFTMGQPYNKDAFRALQFVVNAEFAKKQQAA